LDTAINYNVTELKAY